MSLLWPGFLLLLGIIPLSIGIYIWLMRRRRYAVRFSSLSLVRAALPRHSFIRRHLPFALFLLAVAALVMALVRPVATVTVPADQATIILAIDVSRSMRQADVPPSRLHAAKAAALAFIRDQNPSTQIGIVAFYGYAELIQEPTNDRRALETAVMSLTLGRRTAIGAGIVKSLEAITDVEEFFAQSGSLGSSGGQPVPVTGDAYAPSIVVLLTDGVSNTGPIPQDAAKEAVDRGIRIFTIGFGTAQGDNSFGRGGFGGFGSGGFGGGGAPDEQFFGGFRRGIDDQTLKEIADMTGGTYYSATSAGELQEVFDNLPTHLITRTEFTEIGFIFIAAGALLAALAILLALLWHPLP